MPEPYLVVLHSPGEWLDGTGFNEQPGVEVHIAFMGGLMAGGRLALGGPFLDDSGGVAVVRASSTKRPSAGPKAIAASKTACCVWR